jgi:hypothetical protein
MARYLTKRDDIRQWVESRGGYPIMMETPDPVQGSRALIQLTFGQHALNADHNEGPDRPTGGFELVDWDTWLDAFDNAELVLVVDDELEENGRQDEYRLMARSEI